MQRKNMIERKQNPEQKGRTILRNILITVGIMGAATIVCLALQHFSEADTHVPLLFVLAVVIVARFTDCLLYTSDAADDLLCVDIGGRRNIKKTNTGDKI